MSGNPTIRPFAQLTRNPGKHLYPIVWVGRVGALRLHAHARPLYDTYSVCILVSVADDLIFDWDEANVAHIARHGVRPREVEQVFANDPMDLGAETVDGEERYTTVGHTNRLRVLVLAWTMRGDATRPITAFDASERLAKRYLTEKGF